jgi:hypothetical protein
MLPTSSACCGISPEGLGTPGQVSLLCTSSEGPCCDLPRGAVKSASSQSSPARVTV